MAHKILIGGTAYDTKGGKCLVGGTVYSIKKGRTLVGGTGYDISFGIPLGSIAEGTIVYINENGAPAEFYVAKHNYENSLNGMGRTLVVRKDCYDRRQWHSSNVNAYASSAIDSWLNGTYKNLLDADIRGVIGTTKIKYTPGNGNNTVGTLQRAIFLLSGTELGVSARWFNVEGSALEKADTLKIAYMNGSACVQWTRSPHTAVTDSAVFLYTDGVAGSSGCYSSRGSRPAFTLPSTIAVNPSNYQIG